MGRVVVAFASLCMPWNFALCETDIFGWVVILERLVVWIQWYSVERCAWQLLRYELFTMWNSIFPEGEPVVLSYWPGDIPDGNILFSESYKRKSPKRAESVLELVICGVFTYLRRITHHPIELGCFIS